MAEVFKVWASRKNPLNGILSVSFDTTEDVEHNRTNLKIATTRYGHNMNSNFTFNTASSSEWIELTSLWSKFEPALPLPIRTGA